MTKNVQQQDSSNLLNLTNKLFLKRPGFWRNVKNVNRSPPFTRPFYAEAHLTTQKTIKIILKIEKYIHSS